MPIAIKSFSGRRVFVHAGLRPALEKAASLSGLTYNNVKHVLRDNEASVATWRRAEYQRFRQNMEITYELTAAGAKALKGNTSLFATMCQACIVPLEASDVSEALQGTGITWNRKRVLQEMSRAVKLGYINKEKRSGAINL